MFITTASSRIPRGSVLGDETQLSTKSRIAMRRKETPSLRARGGFILKKELKFKPIQLVMLIFILTWLIFFHTRGIVPDDEGWILQVAFRYFRGESIYKDIQFVYTPGVIYLTTFAYHLFGISVLSTRIIALFNSITSALLIYLIGKKLKFSKFANFIAVSTYLFWGPPVINFIWPVMFCITTALIISNIFIRNKKEKISDISIFFTGLVSALTFIFKQNFGLAILLANLVFFFVNKKIKKFRYILIHTAGYLFVLLIQGLYLLKTNTLTWFVKELYYYTFLKIFKEGIYNSPYPWEFPAPVYIKIFKIIIYLYPLIISLLLFSKLLMSKKKQLIYIPLVVIFYYLLSIRPTTDYVHLAPLIALSGLCLSLLHINSRQTKVKLSLSVLGSILVFIGAHSALMRNYYRWYFPLINHTYKNNHPRVQIWTDGLSNQNINQISKYFETYAISEKEMFIYEFTPLYYFILDKQNPTKYDFLHSGVRTPQVENKIIKTLNEKKIKYILADIELEKDTAAIPSFIKSNYQADTRINKYTIWKLK